MIYILYAREKILELEKRNVAISRVLTVRGPHGSVGGSSICLDTLWYLLPLFSKTPTHVSTCKDMTWKKSSVLLDFYRSTSWIPCKTKCAEYAMSLLQDSTLGPLHVKAASPSLVGPATIKVSFKNAKTITVA